MSKYRCNEETLKFNLKVEGNFFESKSIRICTLEECRGKKSKNFIYKVQKGGRIYGQVE